MSFWKQLSDRKKPFFCSAPMADVTDVAFRRLLAEHGKPDVMWTEFVSANGLMSAGRDVLKRDLAYSENERPIIAQLFSADPNTMEQAGAYCAELGFDGVDINMGCPDKTIEKQGAGASMIKTKERAGEVIRAVKRGIAATGKNIPVSVKTRVGYANDEIDTWIRFLLEQDIASLCVHARTRKELSNVPADWSRIKRVVALRNEIAPQTVIIGNGDVISLTDGIQKAKETGCDGIMVGRALFGNPWFFDSTRHTVASIPKKRPWWVRKTPLRYFFDTKRSAPQSAVNPISIQERLEMLVKHTTLFTELLGDIKSFSIMKKHYKAYCTGFPGAKELRMQLMASNSSEEVRVMVGRFLGTRASR